MEERLQDALANVLITATDSISNATEFVLSEIPDVAQQALLYYGVVALCKVVLGAVILAFVYNATNNIKSDSYWDELGRTTELQDGGMLLRCIGTAIFFAIGCALLFGHVTTALKIYLAPKLWLIEYAGSLVK